jgi:pimeloyl-ACP methyl ester carboxylesterase
MSSIAVLVSSAVLAVPGSAHSTAPAVTDRAERPQTEPVARAASPAHGRFSGRVAIRGGRKLYLECRGRGSPTVVLEAGSGDLAQIWSEPPDGPGRAILPAVARFTRVCAYDRPGTYRLPDTLSRSDPVAMPRTARDIVLDLRALLAHVPGPYVLAGHSFGGMVARLYATTYPRRVAGLVSIDAQDKDFIAAYKEFFTPELYEAAVLNPQPPPGLENYSGVELPSLRFWSPRGNAQIDRSGRAVVAIADQRHRAARASRTTRSGSGPPPTMSPSDQDSCTPQASAAPMTASSASA